VSLIQEWKRGQIAAQKKAKANIEEEFRRIKRMEYQQRQALDRTERIATKEKLKEETVFVVDVDG
jgi:hypothetical protein